MRDGAWVPASAELALALEGSDVASRGRLLPDGGWVFSTRSRALVWVDAAGRVRGRTDEPPGANFGVSPVTFLDREGGLWLANAAGIRRMQCEGVVAQHGPALGLRGGARALGWADSALWVGTAQGLFMRDSETRNFAGQNVNFSDVHALLRGPLGGWLVAAGQRFAEWREGGAIRVPGAPVGLQVLTATPTLVGYGS